jgi:TRAP-type C4-dicarboxylate transport system substrate-binding protein
MIRRCALRRRGRSALVGLSCGLILSAIAGGSGPWSAEAADPVVLRAVSVGPVDSELSTQFKQYIEEVNRRLKGRVEMRLLGGPEVVKPFEHFQALRTGVVDVALSAPAYFVGETIEGVATILLDPTDFQRYLRSLRTTGAMEILNEAYRQKSGVRFIGTELGGARIRFMMAKPVTGLDDLKGKRIRAFSAQSARIVQHFGASPQTVSPSELNDALQRGIVDGALRAPADAWGYGERNVYKYMLAEPVQISTGVVFVATRVWDKLPADAQQTLTTVSAERELGVLNYYAKDDADSIEKLKSQGMKVIDVGPGDRKRIAEARAAYWDEVVAKSPDFGGRLYKLLEPYSK